ncbi:acyl-CoA N-acyltransferase [Agrocybe pediades]|nr:acyl-CoA N-acyltransferase [Agrocybe pediades]
MFDLSCGLRLRAFQPPPASDLDDILSMYNNVHLAPFISECFPVPQGQKVKDTMKNAIETNAEMFCMVETIPKASQQDSLAETNSENPPEFVGITALFAHGDRGHRHSGFAIGLMPKFWSKGYGTEITKFIMEHAFVQLNMHRISLQVYEGNERAIALYEKVGFVCEGVMRKARWANGKWTDIINMGILVEEWRELQKP